MGLFVRLQNLDSHRDEDLDAALQDAPLRTKLREGVHDVIAAIHGLPDVVEAPLSRLEVYVGRAGSTASHLRNRWVARFNHEAFGRAPSTHAVVALRARTELVRRQSWERTSQRVVNSLSNHSALCCANAVTGNCGRWPTVDECAIYVVARVRRGPVGQAVSKEALGNVVLELLDDRDLAADVVREVSKMVLDPTRATEHAELAQQAAIAITL